MFIGSPIEQFFAQRFIKPSDFGDPGSEFMKSSDIFYWLERYIILLASGESCKAKAISGLRLGEIHRYPCLKI